MYRQFAAELRVVKMGVETILFEQFTMVPRFNDFAAIHYQDEVSRQDSAQTVSDHNAGTPRHYSFEGILDGIHLRVL